MKSVFNSLGSNYSFAFVVKALLNIFFSSPKNVSMLEKKLENSFSGKAYTFYKGRDAIEFVLRSLNINLNSQLITQAFTCWAVEEGIKRANAKIIFADLAKNKLNPDVKSLEKAYQLAKNPKAVLIQHTLGYPADIKKISLWCKQKNLFLIEDLAQALGGKDYDGKLLGSYADAIIFSFGKDKIVDAVSGGACIIKVKHNPPSYNNQVKKQLVIKDLIYPFLTWLIRKTYNLGFGKIIHFVAKSLKLISSPIASPTKNIRPLPSSIASLVLYQFENTLNVINHRRKIALIYYKFLKPKTLIAKNDIENSVNLRFPLLVDSFKKTIKALKKDNIFISDRWYRDPVDCGKTNQNTDYTKSSCPNAEKLTQHIINLPTHINVNPKKAKKIISKVKQWQS